MRKLLALSCACCTFASLLTAQVSTYPSPLPGLRQYNGTSLPASCTVGMLFQLTSAAAGSQLYACTTTNTWTLQGGSGGGVTVPSTSNVLKGNGSGGVVAATAGTDFQAPLSSIASAFTLLVEGASAPQGVSPSTAGYVLTSNGTSALPSFQALTTFTGTASLSSATLNTTGGQPTCSSTTRGALWLIRAASGTADSLQVCAKSAADTYAWVQIF